MRLFRREEDRWVDGSGEEFVTLKDAARYASYPNSPYLGVDLLILENEELRPYRLEPDYSPSHKLVPVPA